MKKKVLSIFLVFVVVFLAGCENDDYLGYGNANVSPLVEQWRELVTEYAAINGVSEYVEILLAILAQESGGDADRYPDIFQASESRGDPPNTIQDPEESIAVGVKYFAETLRRGEKAGVDIDTVIQSYNFGGGYIDYIAKNYGGQHSEDAARAFSSKMAGQNGWSSYGDVLYVAHVRSKMSSVSGEGIGNYEELYSVMKQYEGVAYVWGGTSINGVDCSGLMVQCYKGIGVSLPRTAQNQYNAVSKISANEAKPGDLIFFRDTYDGGDYITHVAIYTAPGRMFHASSSKKICLFQNISQWHQDRIVGYGRVG